MSKMKLARNIGIIGAFVTFVISPNTNLDPINLIKFFFLFIGAGYLIADYKRVISRFKTGTKTYRYFVISTLAFVLFQFVGLFFSGATLISQIYGVFGRNTGFLTYLALSILVLLVSTLENSQQVREVIKYLLLITCFEIVYGLFQFANLDPYSWKNLYNRIIGTLGNPNFSSAFYGIVASLMIPYLFAKSLGVRNRLMVLVGIGVLFFLTVASHSWQGTGLIMISLAIYFLTFIRSIPKIRIFGYPIGLLYLGITALAVRGFQGDGPFGTYLNKPTFTIRMDYWQTAINTIKHHLLFGVGSDNFGDWFRLMRDEETVKRIGLGVTTNSTHNVALDIMANTGLIAGVLYLSVVALILWKALSRLWSPGTLDNKMFLPLFLGWFAYFIQSMVSINQIGVGVWGWILQGLMVTLVLNEKNFAHVETESREKKKSKIEKALPAPSLLRIVITPIFVAVAALPLYADAKLISSLKSGDENKVYVAVTAFPLDPARLNYATQAFSQNKLPEISLKSAKFTVERFPNSFDAWDLLRQVTNNQADRDLAISNMKRLDPYFEKYSQ
jgi:O-antigen ligase